MHTVSLDGFAVVTGAGNGIGKETAFAFAEAGAKGVLFADIKEHDAKEAASHSKTIATFEDYKALSFQVDVTDAGSVQKLVDLTMSEFGRVDYLVNSAGIDVKSLAPFPHSSIDDLDKIFDVNVRGTFIVSQAFATVMAKQEPRVSMTKRFGERSLGRGSIVNLASAMSVGAIPRKTPYTTAKHALLGLTRSSAVDLNKIGIRVNCVSPTWVQTPLLDELREAAPQMDNVIKSLVSMGRAACPDEVAGAVLYLSGPGATYVTGTNLIIDNGLTLGPSV